MCGRFNVIDSPGIQDLLKTLGLDISLPPAINIAPTENIPLIRGDRGDRGLDSAHWWLVPSWAREVSQKYSMFNARSETLSDSRAFAKPFRSQRGLVPMSSFIEWRAEGGVKQPWLISNPEGALAVAALWEIWEKGEGSLLSCTLVTTAAAPSFAPWHKRMPVLLAPDEREAWLDNSHEIAANSPIFRNELKTPLTLAPLPRAVSNSRHKDQSVLEAVGETIELAG